MRNVFLAAAVTVGLAAAPASAAVTISTTPNGTTVSGTILQSFSNDNPNDTAFVPGPNEAVTGTVNTFTQNTASRANIGDQHSGNFLGILGGPNGAVSSYSITLPAGTTSLSFLLGTLDGYNSVQLVTSAATYLLTGGAIANNTFAPNTGGSITYTFSPGETLTSAIFSASEKSMEIDSVASATPEPATWAMMILGFGLVGGAMRRRTRKLATA